MKYFSLSYELCIGFQEYIADLSGFTGCGESACSWNLQKEKDNKKEIKTMCPPPCGSRRSYKCSSCSSKPAIKTRINKSDVEEVIASGDYECFFRRGNSIKNESYEGCTYNLFQILHDGPTKVKIAGRRNKDYIEGYRTIIMDAPCFPATFLLRTEE